MTFGEDNTDVNKLLKDNEADNDGEHAQQNDDIIDMSDPITSKAIEYLKKALKIIQCPDTLVDTAVESFQTYIRYDSKSPNNS